MPIAKSVSLAAFTTSVQAAVKAATDKHPAFKSPLPDSISEAYLIRGVPVPDEVLAKVSFADLQTFTGAIASQIVSSSHGAFSADAAKGAMVFAGGHLTIGVPVPPEMFQFGK